MTTHPTLDLHPLVVPDHAPEATIAERFEAFHAANPHVADDLERLAAHWLSTGKKRIGVKVLIERLRWEAGIHTTGDDAYRLNNSLTSHYARLLLDRHPEWSSAIETRALRAA